MNRKNIIEDLQEIMDLSRQIKEKLSKFNGIFDKDKTLMFLFVKRIEKEYSDNLLKDIQEVCYKDEINEEVINLNTIKNLIKKSLK